MEDRIPKIISEGLEGEIIPGTLGLRLGDVDDIKPVISEAETEERVNPRALLDEICVLRREYKTSQVEFDRLLDIIRAGGSKKHLRQARLYAYEISQIWGQITDDMTKICDAFGMAKVKIK
jgi:hypothetical protein